MTSQPLLAIGRDRRLCGLVPSVAFYTIQRRVGRGWARLAAAHRQRRILELIAVLWLMGAVDLILTLWAQRFTPFHELNPIARSMLEAGTFKSVVLFKLSMMLSGSAAFWVARHRRSAEGALWLLMVVYVALMFRWSAYTANADELVQDRQIRDFVSTPLIAAPPHPMASSTATHRARAA
jgi:hypothetical protein